MTLATALPSTADHHAALRSGIIGLDDAGPSLYAGLAGIETRIDASAGALLFGEGDAAENVYGIVQGVAMTYKMLVDGRRQVTGFLFPGDLLGMTFEGRHIYAAETLTPCRLRRYSRSRLEQLLKTTPSLERQLLRMASHELQAAQGQLLLLGRKTAQERLASFLCHLARRQEERGEPESPVWLPVSQSAIADYLGLTLETVSRITTRLRRLGLISTERRHYVHLADLEALDDMANGLA